jgi:outer membrane protein OmpA-like peptidoglycan-associated protein
VDAYFSFDSSVVSKASRTPLDRVAECFTKGPLAGRSIALVGRADPLGPSEFNVTLGQYRADAVGQYLQARGMARAKTRSTSRGSMDAMGSDQAGWRRDRRVDVQLGD